MSYQPKFNYGPHRLEKSDTNDLVEDLIKGGPGSGKKGHTSPLKSPQEIWDMRDKAELMRRNAVLHRQDPKRRDEMHREADRIESEAKEHIKRHDEIIRNKKKGDKKD